MLICPYVRDALIQATTGREEKGKGLGYPASKNIPNGYKNGDVIEVPWFLLWLFRLGWHIREHMAHNKYEVVNTSHISYSQ
jgi:hypothetical protein